MSRLVTASVALVTFVGIATLCTRHHFVAMQAAAIDGARAQLVLHAGDDLAAVHVSHPGRAIELTGNVSTPAERVLAEYLVRKHALVSMVSNRIEVLGTGTETLSDWTGRELLAEDSFESGDLSAGVGTLARSGERQMSAARDSNGSPEE